MKFSLFTRRSREPSPRLTVIARLFQIAGVFAFVSTILFTIWFLKWAPLSKAQLAPYENWQTRFLLSGAVQTLPAVSLFLIGRALLRRQQWGAILAAATLGSSISYSLRSHHIALPILIPSLIGLTLVASVWPELSSVPDDGEVDTDPPPKPSTLRSGGFGSYTRKLRDAVSQKSPNPLLNSAFPREASPAVPLRASSNVTSPPNRSAPPREQPPNPLTNPPD